MSPVTTGSGRKKCCEDPRLLRMPLGIVSGKQLSAPVVRFLVVVPLIWSFPVGHFYILILNQHDFRL